MDDGAPGGGGGRGGAGAGGGEVDIESLAVPVSSAPARW